MSYWSTFVWAKTGTFCLNVRSVLDRFTLKSGIIRVTIVSSF